MNYSEQNNVQYSMLNDQCRSLLFRPITLPLPPLSRSRSPSTCFVPPSPNPNPLPLSRSHLTVLLQFAFPPSQCPLPSAALFRRQPTVRQRCPGCWQRNP